MHVHLHWRCIISLHRCLVMSLWWMLTSWWSCLVDKYMSSPCSTVDMYDGIMALEQLLTGSKLVLTSRFSSVTVVLLGHEHIWGYVVTSCYQSHATCGSWITHTFCWLWLCKSCCVAEWAHAMFCLDISLPISCSMWTVDRSVIMLVVVVHHV